MASWHSGSYPVQSSISEYETTVILRTSSSGVTGYVVAVLATDATPSALQIKNGTNADDVTVPNNNRT